MKKTYTQQDINMVAAAGLIGIGFVSVVGHWAITKQEKIIDELIKDQVEMYSIIRSFIQRSDLSTLRLVQLDTEFNDLVKRVGLPEED